MLKQLLALVGLLSTALAMAAVDVNQATEAELDSVKGIGPGTSRLILKERRKAPFTDWHDFISRVKGVGEVRATHLSDAGLTVGGKAYQPAAAGAKKDKVPAREEKPAEAKAGKKDGKDERKIAAAATTAASAARK